MEEVILSDGTKPIILSDGTKPIILGDGTKPIILGDGSRSITLGDGTEITMREPLTRDMRASNKIENPEDREFFVIVNLTGITESDLESKPYKDYQRLSLLFNSFLLLIGKTASKE